MKPSHYKEEKYQGFLQFFFYVQTNEIDLRKLQSIFNEC